MAQHQSLMQLSGYIVTLPSTDCIQWSNCRLIQALNVELQEKWLELAVAQSQLLPHAVYLQLFKLTECLSIGASEADVWPRLPEYTVIYRHRNYVRRKLTLLKLASVISVANDSHTLMVRVHSTWSCRKPLRSSTVIGFTLIQWLNRQVLLMRKDRIRCQRVSCVVKQWSCNEVTEGVARAKCLTLCDSSKMQRHRKLLNSVVPL